MQNPIFSAFKFYAGLRVKRRFGYARLDGTEDKSSVEQQVCKSDAIVYIGWQAGCLVDKFQNYL